MSWREQLRPASFRGIAFSVVVAGTELGRRVQVHEFPFRDTPYVEDLGGKKHDARLEIYVLGEDYMAQRDALIIAFKKKGPGTLMHPYFGQMQVAITNVRLKESASKEGGMARFSVAYVESSNNDFTKVTVDTKAVAETAADEAITIVISDFANDFSVLDHVGWVADEATATVSDALAVINKKRSDAKALIATVYTPLALAVELAGRISALPAELKTALNQFGNISHRITGNTPSRVATIRNFAAFTTLVKTLAVIGSARDSASMVFTSRAMASNTADNLVDAIDDVALLATDEGFSALTSLRVSAVNHIYAQANLLEPERAFVPRTTLPALVVAHQYHGDATRADDIIEQYGIRHPSFVPGGVALTDIDKFYKGEIS